jgi:hypothetical protein
VAIVTAIHNNNNNNNNNNNKRKYVFMHKSFIIRQGHISIIMLQIGPFKIKVPSALCTLLLVVLGVLLLVV